MTRIWLIALLLIVFLVEARAETRFFDDLGDVPVMPAIEELPERTLVFDKPEGRIAQVMALVGPDVALARVQGFYREILPQFGWRAAGGGYVREGQKLTISGLREGERDIVVLRLEPR